MMAIKIALTIILTAAGLASARPGSLDWRAVAAAEAAEKAGTMSFVGQLVPGGPSVTLYGTAKSIYEQILELNPEYDPTVFPEYRQRNGALRSKVQTLSSNTTAVSRRDQGDGDKSLAKRDHIICDEMGDYVSQPHLSCTEGLNYLVGLNGYCGAPAGFGGCARVSCSNNCGMFLCNDNPFPISVWCGNIAGDIVDIVMACEKVWGSDGVVSTAHGQIFRTMPPGWNSILTSQRC